jgi:hypothetical protein
MSHAILLKSTLLDQPTSDEAGPGSSLQIEGAL